MSYVQWLTEVRQHHVVIAQGFCNSLNSLKSSKPGGSNESMQRHIVTTPKIQQNTKIMQRPTCMVSTECQNDMEAKTFANFAFPPALLRAQYHHTTLCARR